MVINILFFYVGEVEVVIVMDCVFEICFVCVLEVGIEVSFMVDEEWGVGVYVMVFVFIFCDLVVELRLWWVVGVMYLFVDVSDCIFEIVLNVFELVCL